MAIEENENDYCRPLVRDLGSCRNQRYREKKFGVTSNGVKELVFKELYAVNAFEQVKSLAMISKIEAIVYSFRYICNLQTGGKIPPEQTYQQIKRLWKELKRSKKELAIGENF